MRRAAVGETKAAAIGPPANAWRATLSAGCATLVGIGLARFAYTPLLPAIIAARWFSSDMAAYLGAANLTGYLAGALLARTLAAKVPARIVLRAMMLVATGSFFACAAPLSFVWFFVWRALSGLAGGTLMVLAAPVVLPHVPQSRRGVASGVIFAGVGLGIAASGTLVPLLLSHGLAWTWCGLGAVCLFLTAVAWTGWPRTGTDTVRTTPVGGIKIQPKNRVPLILVAVYGEYALNAAALVPHMLFLVDFVARGLGQGLASGSHYWVLFGLGAVVGPVLSGHLADRTGFGPALRLALLMQAVAVALPWLWSGAPALIVSSLVAGAFTPGVVPLVLGRLHELLPNDTAAQGRAWSTATTGFALLQAGAAYASTFALARSGGNYPMLFALGAGLLLLALGVDLVVGVIGPRGRRRR